MPRIVSVTTLALVALLGGFVTQPAAAQGSLPPHAWLFGAWIGGLYPPPSALSAQECLAQPVVIFTKDLVMRATITEQTYTQRLVETARVTPAGVEFRFAQSQPIASSSPFGLTSAAGEVGFGCENPDVLHVQRRGENEISFPGCADFAYPLIRCPAR